MLADDAAAAAQRLQPDLSVVGSAVSGDPRQVLIDLSAHAQLLVVGREDADHCGACGADPSAHGRAHAACPVVVCRLTTVDLAQTRVIVGAHATPESLPVIEFAHRQASLRNLPLTVLHCFWDAAAAVAQYHHARGEKAAPPELEDLRAAPAESVAGIAESTPTYPSPSPSSTASPMKHAARVTADGT